ncbi:ATP-binding protein [Caulobacter segnis]
MSQPDSEFDSRTTSDSTCAYGYLSLLEANQDSAWILRTDGHVEHANQKALALFGEPSGVAADWRALWPEESRFSLDRSFNLAADGTVARFRAFLGGVSKARVYSDTTIAPMRDAQGRIVRLLATARDVTEEVETQGFLRTVLQLLPLPLTVKNVEDRRYVLINRAAEDVLDLVADESIGKTVDEVLPAVRAERTHTIEAAVLRNGEMQVLEEAIEIGGETRHLLIKTLATYDDIGARHMITLGEDITARRAAAVALRAALDEAEQASQAKSAFLANMSHEIRTPLNGIIAGADLLSKVSTDPRARELVDIISASGRSLERLLSDVLDLVRIEAGQMMVEAAPFELGDMARSVASLCALRADEKGVRMSVAVEVGVDRAVTGDSARLRQVLTNLLSNAVKFTDRGEVSLAVTQDADGRTRFTVTDTGIGFDEATKVRICERFQQADASFTRRFGGTGLGLAISRELIELMGGELDCDSTPEVGSSFWFSLPLTPCAESAPHVEEIATAPSGAPRVLVADDHPTNRKVVELMLADVADIVSVENGQEAVEMYGLSPPDLVLMDMQMPVMDGLEAVRQIRALEASRGSPRAPIIMLTANARPEHVQASREAGADVHLQKPITSAALFAAIGEAMDVRADNDQDTAISA